MRGNVCVVMTIAGWGLLAACNPNKGQTTDGGASSSGTTEVMTAGSSGTTVTTTASSSSSGTSESGTDSTDGFTTSAGTSGGSVTSGATGTTATSSTTADGTTTDIGTTTAGSTTGGTMLTECNGCTCDPAVGYCQVASSQTMDPPPEHPSGACPFIEAGVYDYGCVAYSAECGKNPSCECVPKTRPICGCMDAGDFLVVNCDYP